MGSVCLRKKNPWCRKQGARAGEQHRGERRTRCKAQSHGQPGPGLMRTLGQEAAPLLHLQLLITGKLRGTPENILLAAQLPNPSLASQVHGQLGPLSELRVNS
jgi:hypothetical protein